MDLLFYWSYTRRPLNICFPSSHQDHIRDPLVNFFIVVSPERGLVNLVLETPSTIN